MSPTTPSSGTAASPRPAPLVLALPQPCPVCGSPVNAEHILPGDPHDLGEGLWRCRVRIFCEFCEGVAELWYEARWRPNAGAHSVWWRRTGRRRWHDGRSRVLIETLRALTRHADSGVILAGAGPPRGTRASTGHTETNQAACGVARGGNHG